MAPEKKDSLKGSTNLTIAQGCDPVSDADTAPHSTFKVHFRGVAGGAVEHIKNSFLRIRESYDPESL